MASDLGLYPPIIEKGQLNAFRSQNKTVNAILSPRANSLAAFVSPNVLPPPQNIRPSKKNVNNVYTVQWDTLPEIRRTVSSILDTLERKPIYDAIQFLVDVSVIYTDIRVSLDELRKGDTLKKPTPPIRKLLQSNSVLYLELIRKQLTMYDTRIKTDPTPEMETDRVILEMAYTALHLLQTIYIPVHGLADAVVGRDLQLWLDTNFLMSTEEEGKAFLKYSEPWRRPGFWPFIQTCTVRLFFRPVSHFLSQLSAASKTVATREIAELIVAALNGMPNSEEYEESSDFFDAHRQWRIGLHRLNKAVEKHSNTHYEGKTEMGEMVGLINGDGDVLQRICDSCGLSWRDAICVWGIWVQPNLDRLRIHEVAREVIERMPPDRTSHEDMLLAALFTNEPVKAASIANDIDVWLACHLTDLLECLVLEGVGPVMANLRRHFVIQYAEYLMSDPSMWRLAITYLTHCGPLGTATGNQILMHLPFSIPGVTLQEGAHSQALVMFTSTGKKPTPMADLKEMIEMCDQHFLHEAKSSICRTAAQKLTTLREYGMAVDYCAKIRDRTALKRVVGALANEYILHDAREFIICVDQIPGQYLYPPDDIPEDMKLFTARLHFIVKYAEFLHAVSQGVKTPEVIHELVLLFDGTHQQAPKAWWALLMADIGDLLADEEILPNQDDMNLILVRLEEISLRTRYGAGQDYLWALMQKYGMKTENEALQRLERVRFTMIRAAGKSMISHVGGKGNILTESMGIEIE